MLFSADNLKLYLQHSSLVGWCQKKETKFCMCTVFELTEVYLDLIRLVTSIENFYTTGTYTHMTKSFAKAVLGLQTQMQQLDREHQ